MKPEIHFQFSKVYYKLSVVKSIKEHKCCCCNADIPTGAYYLSCNTREDIYTKWYSKKYCMNCHVKPIQKHVEGETAFVLKELLVMFNSLVDKQLVEKQTESEYCYKGDVR